MALRLHDLNGPTAIILGVFNESINCLLVKEVV